MNRTLSLSLLATAAVAGHVSARLGLANPPVELQPASPGTAQTGHINVSGKVLAGNINAVNSSAGAQVIVGSATAGSGLGYGGLFKCASPSGTALRGYATAATGFAYGGDFQSDGPSGTAVRGIATSDSGLNYGVYGKTNSPSGYAGYFSGRLNVTGQASFGANVAVNSFTLPTGASMGKVLQSDSSGNGLWAKDSFTLPYDSAGSYGGYTTAFHLTNGGQGNAAEFETGGTGANAVVARASSSGGYSTAVKGFVSSTGGTGLWGISSASSGTTYGVVGQNYSPNGAAVFGEALATTGMDFGGRFHSWGTTGRGVYGHAKSTTGYAWGSYGQTDSNAGIGVMGFASASSGTTYGVYGQSQSSSASAFSLFALGKSGASGTKSFRIDHPFDPENKYLYHYSAEGPEPLNHYRGTVVTDGSGYAWVQLPDYFDEINANPTYQLTVVDGSDDFVMAKVTRRVVQNRFQIRTSKPGVEVCWRVEAKRNDLWVRKYGAPVEVNKEGREKGTLQHPELYGKPKEMGLSYVAPEKAPSGGPVRK